jgi:hypothetical protein
VTTADSAEGQIRYVLEQNAPRLAAESLTEDQVLSRLSELAAATWKRPDPDPAAISTDPAVAVLSIGRRVGHSFSSASTAAPLRFVRTDLD